MTPGILAILAAGLTLAQQPQAPAPQPDGSASPVVGPPEPEPAQPPDAEQESRADESIAKYDARLQALSPANPEAYFLLGEEVADQANDSRAHQLAKELFVLAFDLSRDRAGRASLQAGCCLALAELVKAEHDRRWLVALARTLDPRRVPPEWLSRQTATTTDSAAYQVATVMGLVRSGDGGPARQLLERPEVKAAFDGYDRMMTNMGITGGAVSIIHEASRWPCPECQNERVIKRGSPPEYKVCPNCGGSPGPELSAHEFVAQLRFESLILQGTQRSWAAQVASDGGAPLMDPDAAGLAAAFDVDPALVLWRNGQWVADPNAPPRPKLPPPPLPPVKPPAEIPVTASPSSG